MKPTTIALGLFVSLAHAKCHMDYYLGDTWTESRFDGDVSNTKDLAYGWISDACNKDQGMFTGYFAPGQTKKMCPQDNIGRGHNFEIQNLNEVEGFDLQNEHCQQGLSDLVENCNFGGENIIAGWRYL